MELSLAVTNSVADLMIRCRVYCTEVFRIPLAGQVTVCCFDKTGTLTSDEMQLRGVRAIIDTDSTTATFYNEVMLPDDESLPWPTARIMAACHSLALSGTASIARVNNDRGLANVIGDPLEKAVLQDTGYHLIQNNTLRKVDPAVPGPNSIFILHRFTFSSRLKRMTVLVREENVTTNTAAGPVWALTKGAPETIRQFLTPESTPPNYEKVYLHQMGLGQRVLAIAYKKLGGAKARTIVSYKEEGRESIECDLTFAGFLLLDCPIKPDSSSVIAELQNSDHEVVMITGDAVLTSAEVARQVGITRTRGSKVPVTYELQERPAEDVDVSSRDVLSGFCFVPLNAKASTDGRLQAEVISLASSKIDDLHKMVNAGEASFCLSGGVLSKLALAAVGRKSSVNDRTGLTRKNEMHVLLHPAAQAVLKDLVPLIVVFARLTGFSFTFF
jgi:cation-transporting ATPase 13A1